MSKRERYQELDCLRGLAAIAVVLFHFTFGYDNGLHILSEDKFYFRYGNFGVYLFFIISGFVIFMTLENTTRVKDFIISRFSRLYPAYWAAIFLSVTITTLLGAPFQRGIFSLKQILINLTMFQHWFKVKDVDGAFWTLAIELAFYFIMAFVFFLGKQKQIITICILWLFLSIIFTVFDLPFERYITAILILKFAPFFIAGIFFYLIKHRPENKFYHLLIFVSLFSELIIFYEIDSSIIEYVIVIFLYVVFYLFIYSYLKFLTHKILVFFGTISYSLYLIHENIGYGIIYWLKKIHDYQIFYIPITFFMIFSLAIFITFCIERPAMKYLRNHLNEKR
ncbi:acyltransferase family protein [Flavobacterium ajazii]|uniref:acyltransferase family protein n=1 Tax=Flavobacterium ajazii TaxID=2692318 RepID=UPI0013D0893B|nr:acyltransferase [Flavobacterium ajazii]